MSGGADRLGRWLPLVRSAPSAYGDDGDCFFLLPPLEHSSPSAGWAIRSYR
ncbi:hypothetical protein BD310DRAFT_1028610 [Dichomitus squalens]|uniref:Uncharacterized protein n=1 Tax=Dichomitus squalens TaxID=114155 RepID=A0A4Q9PMU0_9APHY|nr:hypothetical protein BD310DRAFT_1028610 [Dichomitus squalens]